MRETANVRSVFTGLNSGEGAACCFPEYSRSPVTCLGRAYGLLHLVQIRDRQRTVTISDGVHIRPILLLRIQAELPEYCPLQE